jgi:hypothetical protein
MGRSVIRLFVPGWTVGIVEEDFTEATDAAPGWFKGLEKRRSAARLFFASIVIVDADSHVMVVMVMSNAHHVVVVMMVSNPDPHPMMMVMMMVADLDRHLC